MTSFTVIQLSSGPKNMTEMQQTSLFVDAWASGVIQLQFKSLGLQGLSFELYCTNVSIVSLFISISAIEENPDHLKWDTDVKYGHPKVQSTHELY